MELEIQKLLRSGQTPEQICEPLGIDIRRKDGKILFSYDQIKSIPFKTHLVVKECRGLILYEDNWDVCSMAFARFLNYGEDGADELPQNLEGCYVLEKLDGTMISMYWDRNDKEWHCATRSMIDAEGPVNSVESMTFADLFWKARITANEKAEEEFRTKCGNIPHGYAGITKYATYVFELTSPYNRIVTRYPETTATLLSVRLNTTLKEYSRKEVEWEGIYLHAPVVRAIDARNFEELLKMENEDGSSKDPEFEGYVIVKEDSPSHKRNKLKNPSYLALHRIATSVSERNLMELIKADRASELLERFPEYTEKIDSLINGLESIRYTVSLDWLELKGIQDDRKAFALEACKKKLPHFLFALKDGRVDEQGLLDYIKSQRTDMLLNCMEKISYMEEEP